MNDDTRLTIRDNTRAIGVLLQGLSVLTLFGTFFAAFKVASFGSQLGVSASHDPATWIIVVVGLIASLLLAGLGYALAISCAIYDQNEVHLARTLGALRPMAESARNRVTSSPVAPPNPRTSAPPPPLPATPNTPSPQDRRARIFGGPEDSIATKRGGLWEALTKERHFFTTRKRGRQ